ncbi:hypothetical protein SLNWT_1295 [Streptomyces albus]|uniref:Uncharacterized protein n=1 Tax=Streptomyces albus (strain ATCC 21838 / DSM 41398 / FERM P-419 / JCM 4703 / NBRC 107858) TaxID=1081613 RepID=A0A0B5ESF8_STRA4|nr:hypothetical protein SLNWT_1295 [Streptomyces albus]AOU75987.1 hypothetical protein SLNHY_1296 [Streptomyces albus]
MPTSPAPADQILLPVPRPSLRAGSRPTLMDRFLAFDAEHPYVYRALERLTADRLATGATRVGLKALFEDLRWQLPAGVRGLNNNFTALYARKLIADHPHWASAFELRRRRTL